MKRTEQAIAIAAARARRSRERWIETTIPVLSQALALYVHQDRLLDDRCPPADRAAGRQIMSWIMDLIDPVGLLVALPPLDDLIGLIDSADPETAQYLALVFTLGPAAAFRLTGALEQQQLAENEQRIAAEWASLISECA